MNSDAGARPEAGSEPATSRASPFARARARAAADVCDQSLCKAESSRLVEGKRPFTGEIRHGGQQAGSASSGGSGGGRPRLDSTGLSRLAAANTTMAGLNVRQPSGVPALNLRRACRAAMRRHSRAPQAAALLAAVLLAVRRSHGILGGHLAGARCFG